MQWARGQSGGPPQRNTSSGSAAYRGFFAMQGSCQDAMRMLFETQRAMAAGMGASIAGPNGETHETLHLKAIQAKNECLARALCPSQYAAARECILDSGRVGSGKCDALFTEVSQCRKTFWDRIMNPEAEKRMTRIAQCVESCGPQMQAQGACMQSYGPQRASQMCIAERHAAEVALGSCLDPERRRAYDACAASPGGADQPQCRSLLQAVVATREQEGRATLLAMGFSEAEIARESPEALMDMTGVLVMVAFFEDQ